MVIFTHVLTIHSYLEAVTFTYDPHREALASTEGHPPKQTSLFLPPGVVDLSVSDNSILIETGVQVESNVTSTAKVDMEPGMDSSQRPRLVTELWAQPLPIIPGGSEPR